MPFKVGQRWVSQADAKLGLGIVIEYENRRVTLSFPAVGETRTYAAANAPLSRVIYKVGDSVIAMDDRQLTVTEVQESHGLVRYQGEDDSGQPTAFDELDLSCFVMLTEPQQRLSSGQFDTNSSFRLRVATLHHAHRLQQSPVRGLIGSRTNHLPHQVYVANQVARRYAPRVLLADEVGLGKTIEAGMIVHYQLHVGFAERVLIVLPDTLIHQWLVEMLRRFNLAFSVFDQDRYAELLEGGHDNPFESEQWVICDLDFLTQHDNARAHAVAAGWDLLVVDEAHHLHWSEQEVGPEYATVEALAGASEGILLLTGTPEQAGIVSHFARLRLLDPDRFHDVQAFVEESEGYSALNKTVQALVAHRDAEGEAAVPDSLRQHLQPYLSEVAAGVPADELIAQLLDRHGTGRVLFRNTRAAVKGFPERQVQPHPLACPAFYAEPENLAEALQPETQIGDESWVEFDPRVEWLLQQLKTLKPAKVLLICARAETAIALELRLRIRGGVRSAAFHEGLTLLERDRAAAYFADDTDGAQVLVCSEIGSEGRNFQFSHHLVLFDLPLNPDLLEQRIGRLDRIGQRDTIHIHVPYLKDTAQERLFQWYHQGLNALGESCSAGFALFEQFETRLQQQLQQPDAGFEVLLTDTADAYAAVRKAQQEGRDPLLELNSCNSEVAGELIEQIEAEEGSLQLQDFMETVFDQYGVEQEFHSDRAVVIHPSDHMRSSHFPGLKDEGVTLTYARHQAMTRDDMEFLSWEHPMVVGVLDMMLSSEFGNAAVAIMKLPSVNPGTLMLEAFYTPHCSAPKKLQLDRFLPATPVRVFIDMNGQDLSALLDHDKLNSMSEGIKRQTGQAVIKEVAESLEKLLKQAQAKAKDALPALLAEAQQRLQTTLAPEVERLKALSEKNPNVRQAEIDFAESQLQACEAALDNTQLAMQAVRLVVTM